MIRSKLFAASLLLGAGLGGFFDGIALHQIAQWHNMLSATAPPHDMAAMQYNMRADGWFHADHLLELHHVRDLPAHVPAYDWLFLLAGGGGLIALGWWLRHSPAAP